MARVGVIGAGIAGLTAAYRLQQEGISVEILEARKRVGGVIQTTHSGGFLVEHGPNSLRSTPRLENLISSLSLESERVWANEAASTRYVVRNGRPVALPMSPGRFLTTPLFSLRAKLRLLAEPFIRARSSSGDESLAAFTRRRLGREILDYAVAPFVGGVFAGDPEHLSARHAFERLVRLEEEYGSLFWGAISESAHESSSEKQPSSLFSFEDGLHTLPHALHAELGQQVTCDVPVTAIERDGTEWAVTVRQGQEGSVDRSFDALICTVPLHAMNELHLNIDGDPSALDGVWYPPVRVIALGYDAADVGHPLDGFGMLVPPVEENFDILGTLFSSTLFRGRAPKNTVLLTTFVGGARNPSLARRADDELRYDVVHADLVQLLDITGTPVFSHTVNWTHAIPQYTVGYGQTKRALDALESKNPNLAFAGNFRQGVSVGAAADAGANAAERLLSQ